MQAQSTATQDAGIFRDPSVLRDRRPHWYALWVYRGMTAPIAALCAEAGTVSYQPVRLAERFTEDGLEYREEPLIPNLLFIRTTDNELDCIRRRSNNRSRVYCRPGTRVPAPIPDRDMEIFMFVANKGYRKLEQVEIPIDRGDKVRVTDGIFKGAEGYIRRIHGSRRFVVAIEGVAAVAVTHIPRDFLEPATPLGRV